MRPTRRVVTTLALGLVGIAILSVVVGAALARRETRVLPVDPSAHFTAAQMAEANRHARLAYSWWAAGSLFRWGVLAGIVALGGGAALAAAGARLGRGRFPSAFLTALFLLLLLAVATLPFAWQGGYRTERAFGLTRQTPAAWLLDWARMQAFWIPLYAAVAAGFLVVLDRWPRRGWLAAAGAGALLAVAGVFLAPRVIDPLFHDFTPLADRDLAREIETLGDRAGIDVERVLVMDASRRTTRLNAYVTGLGATRQVVVFDNLIERAPRAEVLSVVGHEVGHAAAHHVPKGLLWTLPVIAIGAWGLAGLARTQARATGLRSAGDPAGLPLLWLGLSLGLFLAGPALNGVRRSMEADADWASLELTRDPVTYVLTAERLTVANLMPVTPPAWLVFWLYTHPPILDRIGMAQHWEARNIPETPPSSPTETAE